MIQIQIASNNVPEKCHNKKMQTNLSVLKIKLLLCESESKDSNDCTYEQG